MKTFKHYSYEAERAYYSRGWPQSAKPYLHLEPYLHSLVDQPQAIFRRKRVLEIGAGEALYSRMIAEHFAAKLVVALDLVPEQLTAPRDENKIGGVFGVGGDCFHLPFVEKSFDVVFGSLILHRFRELEEVLTEIHRVLADKGLYCGIEPSLRNPVHVFRQFFSDHSPNEFLLSGTRVSKAFNRCGFEVEIRCLAPRFPLLCRLGLATCMGIWAWKEDCRR